ncbi:hypothetical protein DXT87_18620 [Arthrobacter sp. AET 35A]|nr:hypothetical protein [Arthrobacter sp. AET 35A]
MERGLIECAIRYPRAIPGSLRSRWERGFAEVETGTIRFLPLSAGMGAPAAEVREFNELHFLGLLNLPP